MNSALKWLKARLLPTLPQQESSNGMVLVHHKNLVSHSDLRLWHLNREELRIAHQVFHLMKELRCLTIEMHLGRSTELTDEATINRTLAALGTENQPTLLGRLSAHHHLQVFAAAHLNQDALSKLNWTPGKDSTTTTVGALMHDMLRELLKVPVGSNSDIKTPTDPRNTQTHVKVLLTRQTTKWLVPTVAIHQAQIATAIMAQNQLKCTLKLPAEEANNPTAPQANPRFMWIPWNDIQPLIHKGSITWNSKKHPMN